MKSINKKIDEELKKINSLPELPSVPIDDDHKHDDFVTIDFDSSPNLNLGDSTFKLSDDWIIGPLDLANIAPLLNTVSLNGTGASTTYNIGASGSSYSQPSMYTSGSSYNWGTLSPPAVNITSNGIEMSDDSDIKIGNRSLKKILETVEQRLSILVPDPKKLEHYEALRQAYEHYRTLEALCSEVPPPEKK